MNTAVSYNNFNIINFNPHNGCDSSCVSSEFPVQNHCAVNLSRNINHEQWSVISNTIEYGPKGSLGAYGATAIELARLILNKFIIDSNLDSSKECQINQSYWRSIKVLGKKTDPNVIKNLLLAFEKADFIIRTHQQEKQIGNKDANLFKISNGLYKILNPKYIKDIEKQITKDQVCNQLVKKGFNPYEIKKCTCCKVDLELFMFGPNNNPSCKICYSTKPKKAFDTASKHGKEQYAKRLMEMYEAEYDKHVSEDKQIELLLEDEE